MYLVNDNIRICSKYDHIFIIINKRKLKVGSYAFLVSASNNEIKFVQWNLPIADIPHSGNALNSRQNV